MSSNTISALERPIRAFVVAAFPNARRISAALLTLGHGSTLALSRVH
jgi:hypothetical protein